MRIINYINKNGEPRTVEFSQIIKQWIASKGGMSQAAASINKMSESERAVIHIDIIQFFLRMYDCTLPDKHSDFFQPEIFNPENYRQAIINAENEYNTKPIPGFNVILVIVLALAIFGLVKMCS